MVFSIMARVHASTTADGEFEPQSGQAKDYKIDICRFSFKHEALKSKNKNWLAQNQDNVSEWSDISTL